MMVASPLKLGILGIRGRMGQAILQEAKGFSDLTVVAGTTRTLSPSLPDILLSQEAAFVFEFCDLVIDFSHHELFTSHLKEALSARKPFLVGTTGLAEKDHALFPEAGTQIPLLYTPNTSLGISLLVQHVRDAARLLDPSYDVEIFESHHRHKKDAPSGTALLLGQAIREGREKAGFPSTSSCALDRTGERPEGAIGYSVLRGGGLRGEHQVHFLGLQERITFSHEAFGRDLFATGALQAARWLSKKEKGFYQLQDLWGFEKT